MFELTRFAVVLRTGIDVVADARAQHDRPNNLLGEADPKGGEIDVSVEGERAVAVFQGAATDDGDLGEIEEGLAEGAQGDGGPSAETHGLLVTAIPIDGYRGVDVGVQAQPRNDRDGGIAIGRTWNQLSGLSSQQGNLLVMEANKLPRPLRKRRSLLKRSAS